MNVGRIRNDVLSRAAVQAPAALALAAFIFENPELAFEEREASRALAELLDDAGFRVQQGAFELPTAVLAEMGDGELVVGLCAEYDALPGLGHACGHNIIAGAAALAALALAPFVDDLGITLQLFGTPAEEQGGGKILMLDRGAFDRTHALLMTHPAPDDQVEPTIVAVTRIDVAFSGETPPAMFPENARNAGAAATLMEVAVALARQSMRRDEQISGVIVSSGLTPNVVPDRSVLSFMLRAGSDERLSGLVEQLRLCAEGAGLATRTSVIVTEPDPRYGALRHHEGLGDLYRRNAESIGRSFPDVSDEDAQRSAGSDFGNVSAHVAAIHPLIGIAAQGASNHQAAFAEYCGGPAGERAIVDAGTAMALTIVDLATDHALRAELRAEKENL